MFSVECCAYSMMSIEEHNRFIEYDLLSIDSTMHMFIYGCHVRWV